MLRCQRPRDDSVEDIRLTLFQDRIMMSSILKRTIGWTADEAVGQSMDLIIPKCQETCRRQYPLLAGVS